MDADGLWKPLLGGFAISLTIFAAVGQWGVTFFGLGYGAVFGGLAYRKRRGCVPSSGA